jgi:hypothetical protein
MNISDLHDSHLIGLSVDREKRGRLLFELAGGRRTTLVLEGVQYLQADNFRQGNIVLDVVIQKGADCDESYLEQLFGKEYLEQNKAFKESLGARIGSGELVLVAIEPSYGCVLVALCKLYDWTEN